MPPEELPSFYDVIASGQADYVQGTRLVYPMEPGAMRFFNKLGNVAFSQLFTYLLQQPIKDTLCGTKVLWRRDYERIAAARSYFGDFDPFGDFDLIFGAARLNLKIVEIPVRYRDRTYGETNIQRWKHGVLLAADVGDRRPQDQVRVTARGFEERAPRPRNCRTSCGRARWSGSSEHRRAWERNRALRTMNADLYAQVARQLPPQTLGRRIELGSGPGFAREFIPGIELTDLVRAPWHDGEASAEALPFEAGSIGALVLFDVLHHVPSPRRFFDEAVRVLAPGRPHRDVRAVHQPGVVSRVQVPPRGAAGHGAPIRWRCTIADGARDPFDSNQGIPTLLFGRRRQRVQRGVSGAVDRSTSST